MPTITVANVEGILKIYMNGLLHVAVVMSHCLGFVSNIEVIQVDDPRDLNFDDNKYRITFIMTSGGNIVCEYKERAVWEELLAIYDDQL